MPKINTLNEVVYTWVDDTFPGYMDELQKYAGNSHDLNPNRTRDNLDLIKYSLRSLEQYAPWVKRVHIVSARPQIPEWLRQDHPDLIIHHHDQFMLEATLPTYNSFAIVSQLHKIPNLARRFLYFEDDMLLTAPVTAKNYISNDGRIRVFPRLQITPGAHISLGEDQSPWNRALSNTNQLMDQNFGLHKRPYVGHIPMVIDTEIFADIWKQWPDQFTATCASKFRDGKNIVMEHLYPYYLLNSGLGCRENLMSTYRHSRYHGVENIPAWNGFNLWWKNLIPARHLTLNDNFGTSPRSAEVNKLKKWLSQRHPNPSRFEILT